MISYRWGKSDGSVCIRWPATEMLVRLGNYILRRGGSSKHLQLGYLLLLLEWNSRGVSSGGEGWDRSRNRRR